jgi:hypothetical protein
MGKGTGDSVFINGAHHSRELTSLQMVCFTVLKILYEMQSNEEGTIAYFL